MATADSDIKSLAVVFAGVPGTSKTPISHYLSCEFTLPILNTDQIRYEVREDLLVDDINEPPALAEYEKRRDKRLEALIGQRKPFIFDGSMDRRWAETKERLTNNDFAWFMISMELSKPFLLNLYAKTGRTDWANQYLDHYLRQHQEFLAKFKDDINLEIIDETFPSRLQTAATGLAHFLNQ